MTSPAIRPARDEETVEGDDEATAFYISLGAESEGAFEGRILVGAACETLAAEAEA